MSRTPSSSQSSRMASPKPCSSPWRSIGQPSQGATGERFSPDECLAILTMWSLALPGHRPSESMRFVKMHGIGNDYVYVDCFNQPEPTDPAALSRAISNRNFGIGSDGLILVCRSDKADARMRMFNADGSESEMCGNGVRCVARFVHDRGLSANNPLRIETGRGVLTLHLTIKAGKAELVRVDMG